MLCTFVVVPLILSRGSRPLRTPHSLFIDPDIVMFLLICFILLVATLLLVCARDCGQGFGIGAVVGEADW